MLRNIRKLILFTALIGALAYAAFDPRGERLATGMASLKLTKASEPRVGDADASAVAPQEGAGRFALQERVPLSEMHGQLFGPRDWQPPVKQAAGKPATPVAPPMPYRFAGKLLQDGKMQVILAKGDATFPVREGEVVDGLYRVESIGEDRITLVYLPLKHKETIPVFSLIPNAEVKAKK